MSTTISPASGLLGWRVVVIGLVAALAIGIGVAAGGFLLTRQAGALGAAAGYLPADAPIYVELSLEPSEAQDAALRELLARFPPIDGLDLERPLYDQLGEKLDEALAAEAQTDLRWSEDVEPWLDGQIALGVTDLQLDAVPDPADPMAVPPMPEFVAVLGITDPEGARATTDRLEAEAAESGASFTESEHAGVTIHASDGGAYAITDDALLIAAATGPIEQALDTVAGDGSLADDQELSVLAAELPADRLAFVAFDLTEAAASGFGDSSDPAASALASIYESQPMRGAMAFTVEGDRLVMESVSEAPSGDFALENADRGLAAEVPGDALLFSEGGGVGAGLSAFVEAMKATASTTPEAAEQIEMVESALGTDLEGLVAWVGDGALAVGHDGAAPYAGLVLVPTDVAVAERRLGQLGTFAGLAALDPASGISVGEEEIAGATVTTIRWEDPNAMGMAGVPVPTGVAVQYTVTDDRALIGVGDTFVGRALELEPADSLAGQARYADAVAELGGATNAGVSWMDVAGTREALEEALVPLLGAMGGGADYEAEIQPWLLPFDRAVSVAMLEGDLLVQHGVLLVE